MKTTLLTLASVLIAASTAFAGPIQLVFSPNERAIFSNQYVTVTNRYLNRADNSTEYSIEYSNGYVQNDLIAGQLYKAAHGACYGSFCVDNRVSYYGSSATVVGYTLDAVQTPKYALQFDYDGHIDTGYYGYMLAR